MTISRTLNNRRSGERQENEEKEEKDSVFEKLAKATNTSPEQARITAETWGQQAGIDAAKAAEAYLGESLEGDQSEY